MSKTRNPSKTEELKLNYKTINLIHMQGHICMTAQRSTYLWYILLLSNTDKVFKHGHHRRSSNYMAVHQVRQESYLQKKSLKKQQYTRVFQTNMSVANKTSAYQIHSFIVQVVFQRLLQLSDHSLDKLAPKVVVSGIEEAN